MPENVKKIKKFRGKIPLFHEAGIEKSLNRIFEPTVKLTSGGYIVINPTEALVAIDVNSGQSIKEVKTDKKYRTLKVDFSKFSHDLKDDKEKIKFSDLELIFKDLKSLFPFITLFII